MAHEERTGKRRSKKQKEAAAIPQPLIDLWHSALDGEGLGRLADEERSGEDWADVLRCIAHKYMSYPGDMELHWRFFAAAADVLQCTRDPEVYEAFLEQGREIRRRVDEAVHSDPDHECGGPASVGGEDSGLLLPPEKKLIVPGE